MKKPFEIERDGEFAVVSFVGGRIRWDVSRGTRFATKEEAQAVIDSRPELAGASVIEILEETRWTSTGRRG